MAETCCPELPDHVIEDIFARLPAKTVLRCRCLSRVWAVTLSTDDFADRHLRLANRHGGPRILVLQDSRSRGARPKMHAWSPDHPGGTTLMEVPRVLARDRCPPLATALGSNRRSTSARNKVPYVVTEQCRGLVILEARAVEMYYVLNPSTGQMAPLPEGRATGCRRVTDTYHPDAHYASLGIGYDILTRKHKVVRIYYRGSDAEKLPASAAGCEVAQKKPAGWVYENSSTIFAQGHVHWLAKRKLDSPLKERFIVSFSLASETFGTVPLPLDMMRNNLHKHYLVELGGHLGLFSMELKQHALVPDRYMYVWLLHGHETCTWDLHCRIDLKTSPQDVSWFLHSGDGIRPLAFVGNDRRILLIQPQFSSYYKASSFQMCVYAPVTGGIDILLDGSGFFSSKLMAFRKAILYEESLAYPGRPHEDIVFAMSLVLRALSPCTLARLKCVCRSWRVMIESDAFHETRRNMPSFYFIF
ncbi:hypothetical protein VPH35_130943 [Triticum aestivum]